MPEGADRGASQEPPGFDDPHGSEAVIAGAVDASPDAVFEAWTDAALLARWWGPPGFTIPVCVADARPGGRYRIVMRAADGVDYPMEGVYREVTKPERLVFTVDLSGHPAAWHATLEDAVRRLGGSPSPLPVLLASVTFEELRAGGTGLGIRTRFDTAVRRDAFLAMGMNEGWAQSLERLAALLEKR